MNTKRVKYTLFGDNGLGYRNENKIFNGFKDVIKLLKKISIYVIDAFLFFLNLVYY